MKIYKRRVEKTLCICCKLRNAGTHKVKGVAQLCKPCLLIVRAENTWSQFGLKPRKPLNVTAIPADLHVLVAQVTMYRAQGMQLKDIAKQHYNCTAGTVQKWLREAREAGLPVHAPRNNGARARAGKVLKITEHGGGRWGVSGCKCDLCQAVRTKSRRENRDRVKAHASVAEMV